MKFSDYILESKINEEWKWSWGNYYNRYVDRGNKYKRRVSGTILEDVKKMLRPLKGKYENVSIDVGPQRANKKKATSIDWEDSLGVVIEVTMSQEALMAIYVPDAGHGPMRNIVGQHKNGVESNYSQTDKDVRKEAQKVYKDIKACIKGGKEYKLKYHSWIIGLDKTKYYEKRWAHEQTSDDPYYLKSGDIYTTIVVYFDVIVDEGSKMEKDLFYADALDKKFYDGNEAKIELYWKYRKDEITDEELDAALIKQFKF